MGGRGSAVDEAEAVSLEIPSSCRQRGGAGQQVVGPGNTAPSRDSEPHTSPASSHPGTTWMQQVLSLIFCQGHLWPIHHIPNWQRAPWLEQSNLVKMLGSLDPGQPRLLTSHLNAEALGPAVLRSKARVR